MLSNKNYVPYITLLSKHWKALIFFKNNVSSKTARVKSLILYHTIYNNVVFDNEIDYFY